MNWQGSGTILVIDDEEVVRQTLSMMLEFLGFQVLLAADGEAGIATYEANRETIRVVILDMTMPGMSGDEVFRQLQAIDPAVKVLLFSGYSEQDLRERFAGYGLAGFLQKPFTPQMLQDVLQNVLE